MSEKMSDAELNERLAKALGWKTIRDPDYAFWEIPGQHDLVRRSEFSPATSVDDLRDYVLPEIKKRGVFDHFAMRALELDTSEINRHGFCSFYFMGLRYGLTAKAATLAEAALKVLEEAE